MTLHEISSTGERDFRRPWTSALLAVCGVLLATGDAFALCNGGAIVTSTLIISANCDGGATMPLTLDTGADVTINNGVTVSNDRFSTRNGDPVAVLSSATAAALTNNGTIFTGSQFGVTVNGTLTSLVNTGTIQSGVRRAVVVLGGTIVNLTNTGTLIGPFADVTNGGGAIQTFNNRQGAGNASGAVTYAGTLPSNYNIIIDSPSVYGQLSNGGATDDMMFGVDGMSTVAAGAYTNVLSGFTASNLVGPTSGVFGGFEWLLSLATGSTDIWDLEFSVIDVSPVRTDLVAGVVYTLSDIGVTAHPVFDGGTLTLMAGDNSSQDFTIAVAGGTIFTPASVSAHLSGLFSGPGSLRKDGGGTLRLSGINTYAGGTTVDSGVLLIEGASALGTGPIFIAPRGTLMGSGTIAGALTVAGTLKPGYSPGFIAANATVTMQAGSTYVQDIAGSSPASATTPPGASGFYSVLRVTGGRFVIEPGATLRPRLSGLFTPLESGFGSAPYIPALGDRFRIVSAERGIVGRFSHLEQPAELAPGTRFIQFYDERGDDSLELAVIPTSYAGQIAGNRNARSVAHALDELVERHQAGAATAADAGLLHAVAGQNAVALPTLTLGLAGEVHAASVAAIPQATLRLQQSVLSRLGDARAAPSALGRMDGESPDALAAAPSGAETAGRAAGDGFVDAGDVHSGVWGQFNYQYGDRSGDHNASANSNNLYQLIFGADWSSADGVTAGGGFALSNTHVNARHGEGLVQQRALFLYGRLPVGAYAIDTLASFSFNAVDDSRLDPLGLGSTLDSNDASGNDVLVSIGLSRSFDFEHTRITPYARTSWQRVKLSSFGEGPALTALRVGRYSEDGVRAVAGVTFESNIRAPAQQNYSYRMNLALGADTSQLLNPTLDASLAGTPIAVTTPRAGSMFVQAGIHGRARLARNAYAFAGIGGEARSGSLSSTVNVGVQIRF
jgi:autotransporter-associated beta strand protein